MAAGNAHSRAELILTFEDAYAHVLARAEDVRKQPRSSQCVRLLEALGRTLAEDIIADRDFPPFRRATRDGYALHSEDSNVPEAELSVVGEVRAGGDLPRGFSRLAPREALAIMTGAPVPEGADAVIMVEHVHRYGERVRLTRRVAAGENIVARGSEAAAGSVLAEKGIVISHAQIALAAAVGKPVLAVCARPKVAILPTGDEVVAIDADPAENQIRNSNSFSLAAQVIASGGEPVRLPIARDTTEHLRALIAEGLRADLLLLSGGVSAGEYDLVEDVLSAFGAEFLFTGVQIQPGKPLLFGRARKQDHPHAFTYFFGLPGNPISTMVTFELFAKPFVRALSGAGPERLPSAKAKLARQFKTKTGLTRFLPASLTGNLGEERVEPVKWQGSGDLAAFARANCLLVIPPDREQFEPGEMMSVIFI